MTDDMKAELERLRNEIEVSDREVDAAQAESERYREALRFYADPANHQWQPIRDTVNGGVEGYRIASVVDDDKGKRARTALGQEEGS